MEENKTISESAPLQDKVETPVEGNAKEVTSPADVAKTGKEVKSTTTNASAPVSSFNPETSFKALQDQYSKLERSYRESQKFGTQSSMKAAELEKKLDKLTEMFAKATEAKIDPQQFIRDVNERGHLPIVELLQKEIAKATQALKDEYETKLSSTEDRALRMEADWQRDRLAADVTNFPNYRELEKQFGDILDEPNCPVRADLPIREQLVALYQIARNRNAENAVKQAHAEGKQEAEKELVKEAKTAVTGGGKAPGTTVPNIDGMSVDDARKALVGIYGIADR